MTELHVVKSLKTNFQQELKVCCRLAISFGTLIQLNDKKVLYIVPSHEISQTALQFNTIVNTDKKLKSTEFAVNRADLRRLYYNKTSFQPGFRPGPRLESS